MISKFNIPDKLLRAVDPSLVRSFLLNSGFILSGKNESIAEAYRFKNKDIVILPLKKKMPDYKNLMLSLVEQVGHIMEISIDDVLGLIANPYSDIVRYKIESAESKFGHIRAEDIKAATNGLYQVLYNSAHNIAKYRKKTNARDTAKSYADECRFGQTEYGSFVLKIFCPTSDIGMRTENIEPYGREVTRGVIENFQFLAESEVDNPEIPPPPAMSKHVVGAIKEMKPNNPLMFSAGLSVRYSPLKTKDNSKSQEIVESEIQEIGFNNFLFDSADKLYIRYVKAEEFERELLTGYITDLHKDAPIQKEGQQYDICHQISMDLKFGVGHRKVTTKLLPSDYHNAVKWHDEGVEIVVEAVIDKRSKKWVVHELITLQPRESEQRTLF